MSPEKLRRLIDMLGLTAVLVVVMIVLRVAVGPSFFSDFNLASILQQHLIVTVGAIGMTVIIVGGGIDLSAGSNVALSCVAAALAMQAGAPPSVALLVGMLTGAAVGALNGVLVAWQRMIPFIATLGMLLIARGAAKGLAAEQSVYYRRSGEPWGWIDRLMQPRAFADDPLWQRILTVAPAVWINLLLAVVMAVVMARTVYGRNVYALGSNPAAARLCGIRTGWTTFSTYVLGGAFFGLAGVYSMSKLHQGDSTTAPMLELDVIAAAVIGGASLSGGAGSIVGSVLGALLIVVLRNGVAGLGMRSWVQDVIVGLAILVAVRLDQLRRPRSA